MNEKVKVVIESAGNPDFLVFYVKSRVSEKSIEHFFFPIASHYSDNFSEVGSIARAILNHLNTVDGILEVFLNPYTISIVKSSVYEWQEIETDVICAIQKALGKPVEIEKH